LTLLADTSAWTNVAKSTAIAREWSEALVSDQILTCPIVALELLYSARDEHDFAATETRSSALRWLRTTDGTCRTAITALRELSERGSAGYHRVRLPDALIAATAAENGFPVLHYNHRDFDRLAEVLEFDSIAIAPAGAL
jgi:predicted nucleic acid-binding protein